MLIFLQELFSSLLGIIHAAWGYVLFSFGGKNFHVETVVLILVALWALFYTSRKFAKIISSGILTRCEVEPGTRYSLASLFRYIYLAIGLLIVMQTMGLNLSSISTILGFLSVGIGFGLQNLTNNLVSGIIIMIERPIKIGDRVEVGNLTGNVKKIALRSTTIVTNDNIAIIVPNSELIINKVINWSHVGQAVWFNVPIAVSHENDPQQIVDILLRIAQEHQGVCKEPIPSVSFNKFSDNTLEFTLNIATETYLNRPSALKSQLNFAIYEALRQNNVKIPIKKHEIYLKTLGDEKI